MWNTIRFPHVRPVDNGPAANVDRCDVVCKPGEAADHTGKGALVGTVGPLGVPAGGTLPGGVLGVNKDQRNPGPSRLVAQLLPQVVESPGVQRGALRPPSPDPLADAPEVLQGDRPIRALGLLHDAFGDGVVHVMGKSLLLPGELLQPPLGPLAPLLLELSPEPTVSSPDGVEVLAGVGFPVGIGGEVDDAQVYPSTSLTSMGSGSSTLTVAKR